MNLGRRCYFLLSEQVGRPPFVLSFQDEEKVTQGLDMPNIVTGFNTIKRF
jgi:hypothetical protein